MIVDARVDYKNWKLILIGDSGVVEEVSPVNPYFYVIVTRDVARKLKILLNTENVYMEKIDAKPIVYKKTIYEEDPSYEVYKVVTDSPGKISEIAYNLYSMGVRISAHNVRFVVRNCFDKDIKFYNTVPLYYGFDDKLFDNIAKVKILVFDIEVINKKPRIVSTIEWSPFSEVRREAVKTYLLPEEMDEFVKEFNRYGVVSGHNVLGFDIPVLNRHGIPIDTSEKIVFDSSVFLSTHGNSVKIGASRSLLDVAIILKDSAQISDEEINMKKEVGGRVDNMPLETVIKYNQNDVVITAKLLNIFFVFAAAVSALLQIPTSEVVALRDGILAEYYLLRWLELRGYVPEYRSTEANLKGEKVWFESTGVYHNVVQTDVKMMYPSFVLHNYIDPTIRSADGKVDRLRGIGPIYSAVLQLREFREITRSYKKKNKQYEPIDSGVKAILNALAYGATAKSSSPALLGNKWCPELIFYGTREAQFGVIEHLKRKGYKVVYSDTDSFFIAFPGKPSEEDVETLVREINSFLAKYGLEVEVEDVWDQMYIYSKKNYILRKGQTVVIKGSALRNLDVAYLPDGFSLQYFLMLKDRKEKLQYIEDFAMNAKFEELFFRGHQQLWRLIGKDIQSWKRLKDRKVRYARVLTPWEEPKYIVLKKARGGQIYNTHTAPILRLWIESGKEVELENYSPFEIVEVRILPISKELSRLKGLYKLGDALVYTDDLYSVRLERLFYVIESGTKEFILESYYQGLFPPSPIGVIRKLRFVGELYRVEIDEDRLRRLVKQYIINRLRDYKLL